MNKNITDVKGFTCWGAHSGVKSMRRDLAIIFSERPCVASATYTTNKVVAEPLKLTRKHLKDKKAQVLICNAGNANACTGIQGRKGAEAMAKTAAKLLGLKNEDVIVASTGLIGEPFPTEDIVGGIKENIPKLTNRREAGSFAANAILTTDTFAKEGFSEMMLDGINVTMAGIAKGSGMIHPNMATMLAFIVSDVNIDPDILDETVKECVDDTFNMITVDGDTSTNDMVAVMCNGMADNPVINSKEQASYLIFRSKLRELMLHLAKLIVSDGEGSSKFIEYTVKNARDRNTAKKLVRAISSSVLVKTAMFGRDPNWGRIVCASGNAGVHFNYKKADLFMGDTEHLVKVLDKGKPVEYDRNFVKKLLREAHIRVIMDVNSGNAQMTGYGSDLTTDYVLFNSVYTT
ncbi:MAG: bifunctional glutamate N-acetyltransferase/amino-acid acetyltransferase ArgJ [Saprospirales bacterium]|nr:MAG: bifunctional glutamate N-acetyltransferase/amino-acid acetyltransferase ArgJ [Saprospirales bacterium]